MEPTAPPRTRVLILPFGSLGYRFVCECGTEGPPLPTSREAFLLWETHRLRCRRAPTAAPVPPSNLWPAT